MFERIVGHRRQLDYLRTSVEDGSLLHAYLFEGAKGIGKKTLALEIAKELLCRSEEDHRLFEKGNLPDLLLIRTEASELRVEEVKEIREFLLSAPAKAEKKVVLIDDAEKMNLHAQNKILKLVEEPPPYAIFFFICSGRERLLPTLRSRLISVSFNALNPEEMRAFSEGRGLGYDESCASLSGGSAGTYLELLGEGEKGGFEILFRLKEALHSNKPRALYDCIRELEGRKQDLFTLLGAMEDLSSEFLERKPGEERDPHSDAARLASFLRIVAEARYRVERNQHKELIISNLVYRLQGVFT